MAVEAVGSRRQADPVSDIAGDDLFSHQPLCELVLGLDLDCILVCKPSSHETLYAWVTGIERGGKLPEISRRVWNGRHGEIWRYRYVNDLPLRAGDDGLRVNWCELTVTHELTGERLYHNSFVTNLPLDDHLVKEVTHAGRARWKHENEGHNVLTTRGYHIKHNTHKLPVPASQSYGWRLLSPP